mmetsp:Transcript_3086/g.6708  ORF Transcript_3086/g.6708 Transcript_3086/m.6708 type:complete len:424 (-) Transcript_3086:107-1378(-)
MPKGKSKKKAAPEAPPLGSRTGGVYDVKESGIEFRHMPQLPTPKDGEEYLARMRSNFELNILEQPNENDLVFEIMGVDVSFANALRRIMIAEVPTVAIEKVYIFDNTSIIHDEVLAHRLGLVPINIDPRLLIDVESEEDLTDENTLVFKLEVKCGRSRAHDERKELARKAREERENRARDGVDAALADDSIMDNEDLDCAAAEAAEAHHSAQHKAGKETMAEAVEMPGRPYTKHVYSRSLEFVPQGTQGDQFPEGVHMVHDDILLAKLRPGQSIELEAHARRGVGEDHAKFSPVATASYRLMPNVELIKPVYDELADDLAGLYEPDVFTVVKCGPEDEPGHDRKAVVANPYACTMSRNYMRVPELKEAVKITRVPDHFIFSIESVGAITPGVILAEALRILKFKCHNVIRMADESLEVEGLNE